MQFNEYLKLCREQTNLTQEQLVHDLYSYDRDNFEDLDSSTLSKWERNITKPKASKQISIIKYFQEQTNASLPYWDHYSIEETENLISKTGIETLIDTGKQKELILNFPSKMMLMDDMKVYPLRNSERLEELLNINMDIHEARNPEYLHIPLKQFKEWTLNPNNLFLACEYKNWFMGLFFSIRLKPEVFEKLLNFEIQRKDITINDFASLDEMGCNYMLSFYAMNQKIATMLLLRYYAHLITNQKHIQQIGVTTMLDEVKKVVKNMNLHYHTGKVLNEQMEIQAYKQTLPNVLASEHVVKMIFSPQ